MNLEKVLTAENAAQLQEGISLLMSRWSALQMAVANEWGGRDSCLKSHKLSADIFYCLSQSEEPLYIDDLEALLDEFMLSLNTEVEDGSIEEIAEKLMIMREECLEGNYQSIQILRETNPPVIAVPHIRQGDDINDIRRTEDDDLSEMVMDVPNFQSNLNHKDMMVDEPKLSTEPAEAADGWAVVVPRRNRGCSRYLCRFLGELACS